MMIRTYHIIMVVEILLTVRGETPDKTTTIRKYTLEYFGKGNTLRSNAIADCESRNAWVVEIKDEEIDKAIEPWLTHEILIGGKYDETVWKWNDGSLMRYQNWENGAPNTETAKKCLLKNYKVNYKWINKECKEDKKRYICQSDSSYPGSFQITVVKQPATFSEAEAFCSNNGSRLVEIKTPALDSFINRILGDDSASYWTSGQYSSGSWKWGDGNSISTSDSHWADAEPTGTNHDCLKKAESKKWKAANCDKKVGYICQKNITSGSCEDEVCSNRGSCSIVNQRYKCSCYAGYFGTKCEKNIIIISTHTTSYNIKRGETMKITFEIVSYDGNVDVKDITKDSVITSTSGITSSSLTDSFDFTLGPFNITTNSIDYVLEATSKYSESTRLTLNINVIDPCDSNPCKNGASCKYLNITPYFNCACLPAYEGDTCDERVFVENDDCKYHVNNEQKVTFEGANSTCRDLGGSLAMMKTNTLQDFVETQVAKQYGENNPPVIELWIGGIKRSNSWYWLDDTSIPLTGEFAQWAYSAEYEANKSYEILSSYGKSRKSMTWFSKNNNEKFGFVCEIAKTNFSTSLSCKNGGTCIAVGCQKNCQCRPGYIGAQCENKIFTIVSTIYNFTSIVEQTINVTLNVLGYNDSVRVDVFKDSVTSSSVNTINNITREVVVVIGPLNNQSIGTTYHFRATPETAPDTFYKYTSINVVVQGPSQIQNIAPKILAITDATKNSVINCNATGIPIPTVYWYKENILITNNNSSSIHQTYKPGYASLFVENDAKLNFGNYTCHAFNIINGKKKTSNDTALLRGEISLAALDAISDVFTGSVSLTCVFKGYPTPDVKWKWLKGNNISEIVENQLFNITSFVELTIGYVNTTSKLNIRLAEYLGPAKFTCSGNNIYENVIHEIEINTNLVVNRNRAYQYFTNEKNNTDAQKYCQSISGNLAMIIDDETQKVLAGAATEFRITGGTYIGAKRFVENGSKIWRWHDQSFIYNETRYGSWNETSNSIVDGSYVAWKNNSPQSGKCMVMSKNHMWRWADCVCSEAESFICEKQVAGIPLLFENSIEECSSNITISWTPALEAIGIQHRINVIKIGMNSTAIYSEIINPDNQYKKVRKITNLEYWTSYNISITICPDMCRYPSTTTKSITTHAGIPGPVSTANVTQSNKTCVIRWSMHSMTGITGFMIKAVSTLLHYDSENYTGNKFFEERKHINNTRYYDFDYTFNRNYTFSIQAQTCAGSGPSLDVTGNCVTNTGPPETVPRPIIATESNEDNTVNIIIPFPDEISGLISCVFVILVYKPNQTLEQNITNQKVLETAMLKSESKSLDSNDAYIAIAISRLDLHEQMRTNRSFSKKLGDGSSSTCDLNKVSNSARKKRDTSSMKAINARNSQLENDAIYSYYVLSTTPSDDGELYYMTSNISYFTKTRYITQSETTSFPTTIVIAVAGIVMLFIIVVIVFIKLTNKRGNHKLPDVIPLSEVQTISQEHEYANFTMDTSEPKSGTDIPLAKLLDTYNSLRTEKSAKFYEQFDKLKQSAKNLNYPTEIASAITLKKKNRYKNILPSDLTRVKLSGDGESDYINACYINGFKRQKKFIATQGPLPATVDDFWKMIFELKVPVITMLTKCMENGKKKCEQYWPNQGSSMQYGDMNVINIEEISYGSFKFRTFTMCRENEERKVHQLQFLNWPDHGVPVTTTHLLRFCAAVKIKQSDGPTVVHCSAGAGRTGAFIAYDFLMEESYSLNSVDVQGCVLGLRKQRVDMVQTCEQYMLVHKLVLEHHLYGDTDMNPGGIKNMLEGDSTAKVAKQFKDLSIIGPINQVRHGCGERISAMNRNKDIAPYEHNHVIITRLEEDLDTPYLNASTLETYGNVMKLIAAQGPLRKTTELFWRGIIDNNINTIIMLSKCNENKKEQCFQYWPENDETDIKMNNITIHLRNEDTDNAIVRREMLVKRKDEEMVIIQYQYTEWENKECPSNATQILEVIDKMQSSVRRDKDASALVHCSDGAGRTGAFCAIVNLIERLKTESKIDVFRTVKDLRDCRPGMIHALDQYIFCFKAVSAYLTMYSMYANIDENVELDEENPYANI